MTQRLFWDLSYHNCVITVEERERAFNVLNQRYNKKLKFPNEYINCEFLIGFFNGIELFYASGDDDTVFGFNYCEALLRNLHNSNYIQRPIEELLGDNQQLGEL